MKFQSIINVASFLMAANAQANHQHKRGVETTLQTVNEVVTTDINVTVYVDGDSTYTDSPEPATTVVSPVTTSSSSTTTAAATSSSSDEVQNKIIAPAVTATTLADGSAPSTTSSTAKSTATYASSSVDGDLNEFSAPNSKFEDGVYSCDKVPTGNGVISIDWLQYNGWASILNEGGYASTTCKEGYYCSYACQAGMSKTQWPSAQPSTGESRGGLVCKNGKLYRTNTDTDYLCEWGKKTAYAVSKIDKVLSLCRTDYPGSENMCIPTRLTPGSTKPMSVVDSASYFKWEGKDTTAQYYVNDAGIDVKEGCIWGTSSGTVGNWAPVNLGAGHSNGVTYLSIIPNPNNRVAPSYNIKIEAGSSDSVQSGSCVYANGVYNGSGKDGCTVGVTKGYSNFVFY